MRSVRLIVIVVFTVLAVALTAWPAAAQGRGGLCFFEHANFQGRQLCLSPGQRLANLDGAWNDKISSVQIPPGMRATVCEHANFAGRCITLNRSVGNFDDINFNDRVSSISAEAGGPPGGPNFGGPPRSPGDFGGPGGGPGGPGFGGGRDELRARMFELREACERGDRRACVRFGIIIGENRERNAQWRREDPDLFWWDR